MLTDSNGARSIYLCIIDAKAFRYICTFSEIMLKVNKMLSDIFLQIQTSLLKYTKINVLSIKLHILYYCKNNTCRQRMQFQILKLQVILPIEINLDKNKV